jgi:hypothetical protein
LDLVVGFKVIVIVTLKGLPGRDVNNLIFLLSYIIINNMLFSHMPYYSSRAYKPTSAYPLYP